MQLKYGNYFYVIVSYHVDLIESKREIIERYTCKFDEYMIP